MAFKNQNSDGIQMASVEACTSHSVCMCCAYISPVNTQSVCVKCTVSAKGTSRMRETEKRQQQQEQQQQHVPIALLFEDGIASGGDE